MSRAYYRNLRRRKKSWLQRIMEFGLFVIFSAVVIILIVQAGKTRLIDLIIQALRVDTRLLFILSVNIFIIGGILLVVIFQWADRENRRFRAKQRAYRSMLVSQDYYLSIGRVKVDQFVAQAPDAEQRKLDVDFDLKKSSYVTEDYNYTAKEARQTRIFYDENGHLSGLFKTYFGNGNILAEVSYENGCLNGRCVVYYPNGFLHNEKFFRHGKLDGIFRAWDEDGALFFEIEYKDNVQHGVDKSYRKNGIIETEDLYVNGVMVQRKTFDEMGAFKYLQRYENDRVAAKTP